MSMERREKLICPRCGKEGDYIIWQSVNTREDPQMKEQVRNASAFTYTCPCCLERTDLNYDFLYHEEENKVLIYCGNTQAGLRELETFEKLTTSLASMMRGVGNSAMLGGYIYRVVNDRRDLLEKLRIFDAGIDDRAVETLKVICYAQLANNPRYRNLGKLLFDQQDGNNVFRAFGKDGNYQGAFPVPINLMNETDQLFKTKYLPIRKDSTKIIDMNWAAQMINQFKR